jgi:predicted RNA-binding Zn-ribbon protein involved in translation (DUF1610 family)
MQYHAIQIPCPKCGRSIVPMEVCCRADGNLLFESVCVLCGMEFHWETTIVKMVLMAHECDKVSKSVELADMETKGKPC